MNFREDAGIESDYSKLKIDTSVLQITVKSLTGICIYVQVSNSASVVDVKKAIHEKDSKIPPHLQRLVGPGRIKLKDASLLHDCGIKNGAIVNLVVLAPYEIYIQGVDGRMYTITVPSNEPEIYTITAFHELVRKTVSHSWDEYQLLHQGKPVLEKRHGRSLTLSDSGIKSGSTVVITKMGLLIDITEPMVDVCFLVDCTSSMRSYIDAVKNNIHKLRTSLVTEYKKCDLKFSFVRYTDYDQPSLSRTTYLDFTSNSTAFGTFVGGIHAKGGGDEPEDIMGGLQVTFTNLCWRPKANKILIHIADCPCHGSQYHCMDDTYRSGDPAGISHETMMKKVVDLDIQYWFGYINRSDTDKMIQVFNDSLCLLSRQRLLIRQFDAMNSTEVGQAVIRSVTASVYGCAALKQVAMCGFKLDLTIPDWNHPSIIQQKGTKTPPPPVTSLADLQTEEPKLKKPSVPFTFKIALNPFADGSECLVYHASDLVNFRRIVLKKFKQSSPVHNSLECYMMELTLQATAATYAREFNIEKSKPPNVCLIEFTMLDIVQAQHGAFYMLEPYLDGKIVKFNNNCGVVAESLPLSDLMQAFSHYTWVKSGKSLLVCDLQGYKDEHRNKMILTDPAIHSRGRAGKYGSMDGGIDGVRAFFRTHTCSAICRQMRFVGQCI